MKKNYTKGLFALLFCFIISSTQAQEYRRIDGRNNNLSNPEWGAANTPLTRFTSSGYADGVAMPGGINRPNPRTISNDLFAQEGFLNDPRGLSDFTWVFGQFVDHDVTFVLDGNESFPISIPRGDRHFDPYGTGQVVMDMLRSVVAPGTGTSPQNPRNHLNSMTAFIDGSAVYGSDTERASWLRTFSGGKLKVSQGNMLPFNTVNGELSGTIDPNAPHMDDAVGLTDKLFVAGDARANENPLLLSFHTLFVREHNRLCDEFAAQYPQWTDEQLYQYARKMVGGFIQRIIYNEWLPTMGVDLSPYRGYNSSYNPSITNVFSAAAFRLGHTLLNSNILRLDSNGNPLPGGSVALRFAFFNTMMVIEDGIEPFFQGMAAQTQQSMDSKMIDDVRNFLFGPPGAGGLDLAAINIQRGRERGLADYNKIRQDIGLPRHQFFSQINNDPEVFNSLQATYGNINDIDPWVGMLAEAPMQNSLFGQTILRLMQIQFTVLRDGDRFYFENDNALSSELKQSIRQTRLVDIIKRNTGVSIMQENVFRATTIGNTCASLDILGSVQTEDRRGLNDVEIQLSDVASDQEFISMTDNDGDFKFNNVTGCRDYSVSVKGREADWKNGLTTYDMVLLLKHITGQQNLDSPYKVIAADVDGSGHVSLMDIIEMRNVLLGNKTTYGVGKPWRFVNAAHVFRNPNNPFGEDFERMTSSADNLEDLDFIAVKVGDLNNSVSVKGTDGGDPNNGFVQQLKMRHVTRGTLNQIELYFDETVYLQGFQFDLGYDAQKMRLTQSRTGGLPQLNASNFYHDAEQGILKASWVHMGTNLPAGRPFATFSFIVIDSRGINLCNDIQFRSSNIEAQIYDTRGIVSLELDCANSANNDNVAAAQLFPNEPNPFDESTQVRFVLPKSMKAKLTFISGRGQVLHTVEQYFEAGENELTIYRSMLGNIEGNVYYRLEGEDINLVQKMIVKSY